MRETDKGKGAKWEGSIITQEVYETHARNEKFIPVIFTPDDGTHIPMILRGASFYTPNAEKSYESLYRHLTNQPLVEKPVLGKLRSMPSRPRKQDVSIKKVEDTQRNIIPDIEKRKQKTREKGKIPIWTVLEKRDNSLFLRREKIFQDVHKKRHDILHCDVVEDNLGKIIPDDMKYDQFSLGIG